MRADAALRPAQLDAFARHLATSGAEAIPILAVRLPELERVAWRRGLRAARALERRATSAFARAAYGVLRGGDLLAHEQASDVFLAALVARTRDGGAAAAPIDARSALARIAAALELATGLEVLTGWTVFEAASDADALDAMIERAMTRGAHERERYAFFSALGHELRTPLSSIRGYLETLLDEGNIDAGTRRRFVRIAYDESLRMSRLLEGMFEISLLDLTSAGSQPATGSLGEALATARDACDANAAARRVEIEIADVPRVQVGIDTDRLTLVLVNLIDNAVKHGRAGGQVSVGADLTDQRIARITVDDDGPGIATADRQRVFALGERSSTSAKGTGIGLAVVRLMLERAGGRVELEDSPLGGARFSISVLRAS